MNIIENIGIRLSHPGFSYLPETNAYKINKGYILPVTACSMMPNDMGDCEEYKLDCTLPENSNFYCLDNDCTQIVSADKPTILNETFMGWGTDGNRDLRRSWKYPFSDNRRTYTLNR